MSASKQSVACLPAGIWPADHFPALEKRLCAKQKITPRELMLRAGMSAFTRIRENWPNARHWRILCGNGNNGGDGYVVARLAKMAGYRVTLVACQQQEPPAEAARAKEEWLACGGSCRDSDEAWQDQEDLIVDALFGIGLNRAPQGDYQDLIVAANDRGVPIIALDIPSGLLSDSGAVPGVAINASATLTFIALKAGLLTGKARDYCGKLWCDPLGFSAEDQGEAPPSRRCDAGDLPHWLSGRKATAHKGDNGRLVLIGGGEGTGGAIRLSAESALRSGAGLVRVLTHRDNVGPLLGARPELMVAEATPQRLDEALEWADMIAIGPGLGQDQWGQALLSRVKKSKKPALWDADALNLLAIDPDTRQNRILTPHPGEAARLLGVSVAEIEQDRLQAARELVSRYGGVVVLKGAGTLVASARGEMTIADVGNPGMATGGMGDLLSGIIAALAGQKLSLYDAACAGVIAHGAAADRVADEYGMRGILATDLLQPLRRFVNPDMKLN